MSIKFKHGESSSTFYKVYTETGQKVSFLSNSKPKTSGFGMNKEMIAWVAAGNTIEPQYTDEEQTQKEIDDLKNDLESQKSRCIQILNEIDHKFLPNYRRPDDVPQWQTHQDQIIAILGSSEVQEIPDKPF